jgi:hypothetical protein
MLSGENLGVNHRPLSTHFLIQLPDLITTALPAANITKDHDVLVRDVKVRRESSDDKLFSLFIRRSTKKGNPILIVESGHVENTCQVFVPGDQLIAINGVNVENEDREEAVKILNDIAENEVTLQVGQKPSNKILFSIYLT